MSTTEVNKLSPTDKNMINNYIAVFKNKMAMILKENVVIKCCVFPYKDGAILIMSFSFSGTGNIEYKSESADLREAALKANIEIPDTNHKCKVVFQGDRIIEIKPLEIKAWSPELAGDVVNYILTALKKLKVEENENA